MWRLFLNLIQLFYDMAAIFKLQPNCLQYDCQCAIFKIITIIIIIIIGRFEPSF